MYNNSELKKIQQKKLEILIDIAKFCNENYKTKLGIKI